MILVGQLETLSDSMRSGIAKDGEEQAGLDGKSPPMLRI